MFLDNARLDHFVIKVVSFAGPLADAAENRHAAVAFGDVVDKLLNRNRFAHAGAAEQADFTALGIGAEKVDDLDPGHKLLDLGCLLGKGRSAAVDLPFLLGLNRRAFVDDIARNVQNTAKNFGADRNRNRLTRVGDIAAALQAFGHVHRDGAHDVFAKMLRDFKNQRLVVVLRLQRVQNRGDIAFLELHVDDGTCNL